LTELEASLSEIENLLKNAFKDAVVWEQKGTNLVGKYVYMKYEEDQIGLFMGYALDAQSDIRACVTSIFPYPSLSMLSDDVNAGRRSFYKILIRSNLRLKDNPYRMVAGRKIPAIIRTLSFKKEKADINHTSTRFFRESINALTQLKPVYKMLA
jgi:hypothetical protein